MLVTQLASNGTKDPTISIADITGGYHKMVLQAALITYSPVPIGLTPYLDLLTK